MTLTIRKRRLIIFSLLLFWCSSFSLNSFYHSPLYVASSPILTLSFSKICHQEIDKTFKLKNSTFLICARCTGIYFGAFITSFFLLFLYRKHNPSLSFLIISLIPLLLDVLFTTAGIYPYSKNISFLTGMLFGSVLFIYILSSIENNFIQIRNT
jgi:uncharacterized membrane protein